MPSGYTVKINGSDVDLDSIFAPLLPDTIPAAAVNFKVDGSDLSNRYHPITTANQKIENNTNFKRNGTDFRDIFCDIEFTPTPTPTKSLTPTPTRSGYYYY
jgi:hypothetical protein